MVHTFNEGEELPNGKTKQWVITDRDGQPIAIAVICEEWRNGTETLQTFCSEIGFMWRLKEAAAHPGERARIVVAGQRSGEG